MLISEVETLYRILVLLFAWLLAVSAVMEHGDAWVGIALANTNNGGNASADKLGRQKETVRVAARPCIADMNASGALIESCPSENGAVLAISVVVTPAGLLSYPDFLSPIVFSYIEPPQHGPPRPLS